jgi:5-methylcytosine-specific restriction endonuclease McrA
MKRRYGQRLTTEQKLREHVLRRRRRADYNAKRRAAAYTSVVEDVSRDEIIARDGQSCYLCGKEVSIHDLTLDHVLALANGGSHTPDNIRIAHRSCNSKKGTRFVEYF